MMKRVLCLMMVAMTFSFAQEVYIRNICDTLPSQDSLKTKLKLAYIDESRWYGNKDLSKADSVKNIRHQDYSTLEPIYAKYTYKIPYSITAVCKESNGNIYAYGEWDQDKRSWSNNQDSNYVTEILDVYKNKVNDYDSSNSYNVLLFKKNSLENLTTDNMMVSRTFELNFESWFAVAKYKTIVKLNDTTESIRSYASVVTRMDSAKAVTDAVDSLNVPDSVSKVEVQIFHSVLNVPKASQAGSSSSVASISSSSSEKTSTTDSLSSSSNGSAAPEYCGTNPLLSCSSTYNGSSSSTANESSSSAVVQTSSSEQESSSSMEQSTVIGRLGVTPRVFSGSREIRRLDGSKVKAGEMLPPGVYYVKGLNGRWKKQIEF